MWEGSPRFLLARATENDNFILATSPLLIDELVGTFSLSRFRERMAEAGKSAEALVAAYRDKTTLVPPLAVPRVDDAIDGHDLRGRAVAAHVGDVQYAPGRLCSRPCPLFGERDAVAGSSGMQRAGSMPRSQIVAAQRAN